MHKKTDLLLLWAKLSNAQGLQSSHPLIFHSIDTGMVVSLLWQSVLHRSMRTWLSQGLGASDLHTSKWLTFWASLHDIGKATPAFQGKAKSIAPNLYACLKKSGLSFRGARSATGHASLTRHILNTLLSDKHFAWHTESHHAKRLATALGGHHGRFPHSGRQPIYELGDNRWKEIQKSLIQTLFNFWKMDTLPSPTFRGWDRQSFPMVLAGIVSVSDWIASNEDFFPYDSAPQSLDEYGQKARKQAEDALSRLAWNKWQPPKHTATIQELFPHIGHCGLRPVQQAVESLSPNFNSPGLVIIEAPTGEGKTEAAMYLADHWASILGQRGCYFALPTQATSNQMFGRVLDYLRGRYEGKQVNTLLLHGHSSLSAEFAVLRRNADTLFSPSQVGDEIADSSRPGILAAEWFTYRKRGLLAPFGVGTIDQALLSVLQTPHVFVRLFGLSNKTVILDEVHAYDIYMSTLIERMLEWLGAIGSSVVVLSATLPNNKRLRLAKAYGRGFQRKAEIPSSDPYPRITWISNGGSGEKHIGTSEQSRKCISIRYVDGSTPMGKKDKNLPLGHKLRKALENGGCAAVICNTVNRAQNMYIGLKRYFQEGEVYLLHSRYPFGAREQRERTVLKCFGKPDNPVVDRPKRSVLVSTQVIEQSLDLDFDLMATDLAPIDLILQRAGRLHRHSREDRPESLSKPILWLFNVEVDEEDIPIFAKGKKVIYEQHVLLRTWLALRDRPEILVPKDVENLVEAVYDDRPPPEDLPSNLIQTWYDTKKKLDESVSKDKEEAFVRWIKSPDFDGALWKTTLDMREEDEPELHPAHRALTRLGGPTVNVVCMTEGSEEQQCEDSRLSYQQINNLLKRSLTISHMGVVPRLIKTEPPDRWKKTPLLRYHRLLILDENNMVVVGNFQMRLDPELGLQISRIERGV